MGPFFFRAASRLMGWREISCGHRGAAHFLNRRLQALRLLGRERSLQDLPAEGTEFGQDTTQASSRSIKYSFCISLSLFNTWSAVSSPLKLATTRSLMRLLLRSK